jgi:two-component sensor histidine kinase
MGHGKPRSEGFGSTSRPRGLSRTEHRKRHEEHQKLLLNELNHRVKNTLATVQSMAKQTLRNRPDPVQAQAQFEARLIAYPRLTTS